MSHIPHILPESQLNERVPASVQIARIMDRAGIPLEPHQQRVIEEKDDVRDKLFALANFCDSNTFRALPDDERSRLRNQARFMNGYAEVLEERIQAFMATKKAMTYTPWMDALNTAPARPGVYQLKMADLPWIAVHFSFWNGRHWCRVSSSMKGAEDADDRPTPSVSDGTYGWWRGMTEESWHAVHGLVMAPAA